MMAYDKLIAEVDRILWEDWDPIGVMSDPEWPRDEYDSYIGDIYRFLVRGEPAGAVRGDGPGAR